MNSEPPSINEPEKKESAKEFLYACWCERESVSTPIDYSSFDDYIKQLDILGKLD